jgi:hypothetical protein
MPTAKMVETMPGLSLNCVTGMGKVIVQESLRRIVGYVTRALSLKGLESSPTLIKALAYI